METPPSANIITSTLSVIPIAIRFFLTLKTLMGHRAFLGAEGDGSSLPIEGALSAGDVREIGQNCEGAERHKDKPEQLIHHILHATPTCKTSQYS